MQVRLILLAATLCLVGGAHAYGDEYPVGSNSARPETNGDKTTRNSPARSESKIESGYEQKDESDDCN
jgi:hypothetical protein